MKYKKRTWGIIFMSLLVSAVSFAKVTYEDAIADNAAATAKHKQWFTEYSKPENNRPLETSVVNEKPDEWRTIYSGSSSNGQKINIPSNVSEVRVISGAGGVTFPRTTRGFTIASTGENGEVKATWDGNAVSGNSTYRTWKCYHSSNHWRWCSEGFDATIKLIQVK
ncbi:hypothetical protein VSAK1_26535 [Vibrio mediterranei AK1]|uniref:hypothetical protein n=1 Tax=Vibrio mediterranei TaxID=689 RepID=UPI0001542927|nr:hypothetical protein [Vibrio mediterranei]EDL52185.1 hypothetical protein VSAK1_26535 [Vibrio mediterranei AK1]